MKIVFYDTKPYDRESFERCNGNYPDIEVEYEDADLTEKTAMLARGADAVCAFVNSNLSAGVIDRLADEKVRCILLCYFYAAKVLSLYSTGLTQPSISFILCSL